MIRDSLKTEKPGWEDLRGRIKTKFSKLSDPQIDALKGHMDQLTSTVKKAYSYDQTKAEQECKAFNEVTKKRK